MQFNQSLPELKRSFPKSTVGGYVFAEDDTILFLDSYKWPGVFSTPGGKIREGETMEEAFCREILEETGLKVVDVSFLSCRDMVYPKKHYLKSHMIFHTFTATLAPGYSKSCVVLNKEAQKYFWMSIEEALKKTLIQGADSDLKLLKEKLEKTSQSHLNITLKEVAIPVFLGVYPHEQEKKQLVYFTLRFPFILPKNDSLEEVINYEKIVSSLGEFCKNLRFALVETLAYSAASMLKTRFCLPSIFLSVRKEYPLKELSSAEVTVEL